MTIAERPERAPVPVPAIEPAIVAFLVHARDADAATRSEIGEQLARDVPPGTLLLRTCHRVEWHGDAAAVPPAARGLRELRGMDAARHLFRLAVGLESALLGEDQVLHQLRTAAADARARGPLPPALDRVLDLALRGGRLARSWQTGGRGDLASVALDRIATADVTPRHILVVGAGAMGRRAVRAAHRIGASVAVTSRTPEHAAELGASAGVDVLPFDPGPAAVGRYDAVVVALAGPWVVGAATIERLVARRPWLIDLSAPPAAPDALRRAAGRRAIAIDDLAGVAPYAGDDRLRRRLERLVAETEATFAAWLADEPGRAAARAAADRAARLRDGELAALRARTPTMAAADRAEVEAMTRRLTDRLLRETLGARR